MATTAELNNNMLFVYHKATKDLSLISKLPSTAGDVRSGYCKGRCRHGSCLRPSSGATTAVESLFGKRAEMSLPEIPFLSGTKFFCVIESLIAILMGTHRTSGQQRMAGIELCSASLCPPGDSAVRIDGRSGSQGSDGWAPTDEEVPLWQPAGAKNVSC